MIPLKKGVTHSDRSILSISSLALLVERIDDSLDGFIEQASGFFAGGYEISTCREYRSKPMTTNPDNFNAPRLMLNRGLL